METPSLTKVQIATWRYFQTFHDEDLYAILGGSPSFEKPIRKPDSLGLKTAYDVTSRTIKNGKKRFVSLLEKVKQQICRQWMQFKIEHGERIKKTEIVAMIYLITSKVIETGSDHEMLAVTELVCRLCDNSLDVLCKEFEH